MIITKKDEELTYLKKVKTHTFLINGKKEVRVYEEQEQNTAFGNYANDHNVDEKDWKNLTEEEAEAIGENMLEVLEIEKGESIDINEL